MHSNHLARILGPKRLLSPLTRADLQAYVDKRSDEWIDPEVYRRKRREKQATAKPKRKYIRKNAPPKPPEAPERPKRHPSAGTIRKEIISLRTAWNWARRHLGLIEEFPGSHLGYAKIEESLPFMTWEEAEERIAAADDPEEVWDCVYLRPGEVSEVLQWVKGRPVSPWVYPMFVFAAHTGARRSEIVRALPSDVNLSGAHSVPQGSACRLDEGAGKRTNALLQGGRKGDKAPGGAQLLPAGSTGLEMGGAEGLARVPALLYLGPCKQGG